MSFYDPFTILENLVIISGDTVVDTGSGFRTILRSERFL
ncbi:MAG: hypothetical protein ACI88L_000071 [Candidatus Paceibacteria bacterium]|jgi:hypothetical protein